MTCGDCHIGKGGVMKIVEELDHYQVCVRWMPQLLVDVRKERRKPWLLIFLTVTTLEVRAFCHRFSCGSPPFITRIQMAVNGLASSRMYKFSMLVSWKNHGCSF